MTTSTNPAPATTPVLDANGVIMRFGGLTAVNNVSLQVNAGEIVGSSAPTAPARPPSSTA